MAYTDEEMRKFTQVAYADLAESYEYLKGEYPNQTSFSLYNLREVALRLDPDADVSSLDVLSKEELLTWRVSGVHDTNSRNGFYSCIVETSPGEAVVGFRGSEDMTDMSNLVNDWILADVGLVNSTRTNQQAEVDRFLKKYQTQLDGYKSLTMTGHSLGGNLAEYSTIVSEKYGLDDNITQCVSLDGPGFSNEFISKYGNEINSMSGVIKHYRWSLVGSMLNDLPGVDYEYVSVSNNTGRIFPLTRHDTANLDYDNGYFIPSSQDSLAAVASCASKAIDWMPTYDGYSLISRLSLIAIGVVACINVVKTGNKIVNNFINGLVSLAGWINNAVDGIIDWFKGDDDDYLLVDITALLRDVDRLRELYNMIQNNINDMYSDVQALNSMWTGEANSTFNKSFSDDYEKAKKYLSGLDGCIASIENQCDAYISSDEAAMSLVEEISA